MKTVAAISFRNNHSLSMDVDGVTHMEITPPSELEEGLWFCELLVRSVNGTVALQLVSDDPAKLQLHSLARE
jgi:hypothetical protein